MGERGFPIDSPIPDFVNNIVDAAASKQFEELKARNLLSERGFPIDSPIPYFVTIIVRKHEWQSLCTKPKTTIIQMVQEFYANLNPQNPAGVMVSGKNACWNA